MSLHSSVFDFIHASLIMNHSISPARFARNYRGRAYELINLLTLSSRK